MIFGIDILVVIIKDVKVLNVISILLHCETLRNTNITENVLNESVDFLKRTQHNGYIKLLC